MRKPFKIALLVLILPILVFDFISYNVIAAQEINARYILPQILPKVAHGVPTKGKINRKPVDPCEAVKCNSI